MKNKNQKMRDEIAKEIFYGIPPDSERKKMSPEELAILLSECEKNSPKYFLIEHELNIRIVKKQSKPIYISMFIGIAGIIIGWVLGQWQPFKTPTALDLIPQHIQSNTKNSTGDEIKNTIQQPMPTSSTNPSDVNLNSTTPPKNTTVKENSDHNGQKTYQ